MGKVISQNELILQRPQWKDNGKRLVLTTGSFDLLHPGHIRLLEQARSHGAVLVVGVLDDESARADSGSSPAGVRRPVMPAAERAELLAALAAVDFVFECSAAGLPELISRLRPDVIAEGSAPYAVGSLVAAAAKASRIDVVRIPIEPGHSTSRLIDRISQLRA
ncbi:MAG TPA: adenylyltransferase/cytidyltransferase family protein [Candidatus Acidoferrum sp.]|nr:adenylyltransferase/cytidyltransferase family protein [Candidatus Acidoferrum sp.]